MATTAAPSPSASRPALLRSPTSGRTAFSAVSALWSGGDEDDPEDKWFPAVGPLPLLPLVLHQGPLPKASKGPLTPEQVKEAREEAQKDWLKESERASEYVNLLYDFAIGSILSVFSDAHPIVDGGHILAYFSYFSLIWWVWASQVIYDGRFQADDWIHRAFRFVQLGSFAYIGVWAQDFDPTYIIKPTDITTQAAVIEVGSANSFQGTAVAYCISRIFLALQYLYVMAMAGKHNHRDGRKTFFLVPAFVYLLSAGLWIIASLLQQSGNLKLGIAYSGVLLEIFATLGTWYLPKAIEPSPVFMSKRFGDLSVVILAEGILDIVKTLTVVIEGFGLAAGSSPFTGYSECACSLVIVYGVWHFLFHTFHAKARFRNAKTQGVWGLLHFPLHFAILLLLAGLQNVAVYANIRGAFDDLYGKFETAIDDMRDFAVLNNNTSATNQSLNLLLQPETIYMMNKLGVTPSLKEEVDLLAALQQDVFLQSTNHTWNVSADPAIEVYHYEGSIWWNVAQEYKFTLSNETNIAYDNLMNGSMAWKGENSALLNDTADNFENFNAWLSQDLYSSSLFFLPCAGGVVLVAAILNVFRTKGARVSEITTTPVSTVEPAPVAGGETKKMLGIPLIVWGWVPFTVHVAVGLGLCFMGFLSKPSFSPTVPIAVLLSTNWALPTAAISYAALILLDCGMSVAIRRARGEPWFDKLYKDSEAEDKASDSGAAQDSQGTDSASNPTNRARYYVDEETARILLDALHRVQNSIASPPAASPVSHPQIETPLPVLDTWVLHPARSPVPGPQIEIPVSEPDTSLLLHRNPPTSTPNSDVPYITTPFSATAAVAL